MTMHLYMIPLVIATVFGDKSNRNPWGNRHGRFLSLFTLVQFENQECRGATGDLGTCLSPTECSRRRGTANGPCAAGYGTCCTFVTSCGGTIRENSTYFVNPGYPTPADSTGSCQLTIFKSTPDICQIRLDFDQFNLLGPETVNHVCNNDQLIISGGLNPIPSICGLNTANHLYVETGAGASTPITVTIVTSGPSSPRTWKIRTTQIGCTSENRAPEGCLQYYAGVANRLRSFNYDPTSGLQLSNQDYAICIRSERNFCAIQYSQCDDPVHNRSQSFTLSGNSNSPVQSMVGSTGSANFCQNDYVIVPMATNVGRPITGPSANVDRICGGTFSADITLQSTPVRSAVKPFRIWFHSDGVEEPVDYDNKGFCLDYVQQPCTA